MGVRRNAHPLPNPSSHASYCCRCYPSTSCELPPVYHMCIHVKCCCHSGAPCIHTPCGSTPYCIHLHTHFQHPSLLLLSHLSNMFSCSQSATCVPLTTCHCRQTFAQLMQHLQHDLRLACCCHLINIMLCFHPLHLLIHLSRTPSGAGGAGPGLEWVRRQPDSCVC